MYCHEYYEYCSKLNLMPTDEGYRLWLKTRIMLTR